MGYKLSFYCAERKSAIRIQFLVAEMVSECLLEKVNIGGVVVK